jgi:hypothetical protein
MAAITKWNDFEFKVLDIQNRYAKTVYIIEKIAGEWPSKSYLLCLCDGSNPPQKFHFGGNVEFKSDNKTAVVEVYID